MATPAPSPPAAPAESPLGLGEGLVTGTALGLEDGLDEGEPVLFVAVVVAVSERLDADEDGATARTGQYWSRFCGGGAPKVSLVALSQAGFLFLSSPQQDQMLLVVSKTTSVRSWSLHSLGHAAEANLASEQPEV
jgi:hypothetical protein